MWELSGRNLSEASIVDMEDLKKKKRLTPETRPMVAELSIYGNNTFVSKSELDHQLRKIQIKYSEESCVGFVCCGGRQVLVDRFCPFMNLLVHIEDNRKVIGRHGTIESSDTLCSLQNASTHFHFGTSFIRKVNHVGRNSRFVFFQIKNFP
eukprot:TRINITY_DN14224_c0_g1_i2.p1 TRINITY_DN14224_c0_g1~~TRINITY_DN14224_c0_g1_i2.p1  ORF type:complete len:151 (-),score=22.38 TRINITY_DN14224_c0_g1_i2:526-978(-)